jgi:hypothetical protein
MFNAASFDSGWDFWILALLVALLAPTALPAGGGTEAPSERLLLARLAAEGAR